MIIWKLSDNKWRHYQKPWQNSDHNKTKQITYHSRGFDKSYPKMYFFLNLSHWLKIYMYLFQILACFNMSSY